MRKAFFKKEQPDITDSKLLQINEHEVYIVGGDDRALLAYEYDVARSCSHIDLRTKLINRLAYLYTGRNCGHAICMVGKFLYVVGGYDYNLEEVRQTEKFNVLRKEGTWI